MDIEKLIKQLRTESLYADKASLEIMDLCMEAATALSTLQAENEKLRAELEKVKCGNGMRRWIASIKLRTISTGEATMIGPESIFRNGRARRRADMKRLTERLENGVINVKYASQHESAIHRLVTIEDILGNEYDLDRLRELAQADREGRCVVLPRWMKKFAEKTLEEKEANENG